MVDTKSILTVLYKDAGTYRDYSFEASRFDRDAFVLPLKASDKLYVGFRKPLNSIYVNLSVPSTASVKLTVSLLTEEGWVPAQGQFDDTKGMARSGFITWEISEEEVEDTINDKEMFWYQITASGDLSATTEIKGINILFADDSELRKEYKDITNPAMLDGNLSHVLIHEAVRDEIVQKLRNKNYVKLDKNGDYSMITAWDFLDKQQVKQGALFLALSKIYSNFSDKPDDHWMAKAKDYQQKALDQLQLARITVDEDDDGQISTPENMQLSRSIRIKR